MEPYRSWIDKNQLIKEMGATRHLIHETPYKRDFFRDIPKNYLKWLYGNDDLDGDMRYTVGDNSNNYKGVLYV